MKYLWAIIIVLLLNAVAKAEYKIYDVTDKQYSTDAVKLSGDNKLTFTADQKAFSLPLDEIAEISFPDANSLPDFTANVKIMLTNGDIMPGELISGSSSSISLKTQFKDGYEITFENIAGIIFPYNPAVPLNKDFPKSSEDTVYLTNGDTDIGVVKSVSAESILFKSSRFKKEIPYKTSDIYAASFFQIAKPPAEPDELISIITGSYTEYKITGRIISLDNEKQLLSVSTFYKETLAIPLASVSSIYFKNGKCVYLSDITPASEKTKSYFGSDAPFYTWARDKNALNAGPILINGVRFRKGISAHSRTELAYKLDGKFSRFQCTIGLDDVSRNQVFSGSVTFIVLADGKEIFNSGVMNYGDQAREIHLNISNSDELNLVVDWGNDGDILDFADWAGARLLK